MEDAAVDGESVQASWLRAFPEAIHALEHTHSNTHTHTYTTTAPESGLAGPGYHQRAGQPLPSYGCAIAPFRGEQEALLRLGQHDVLDVEVKLGRGALHRPER